MRVVARRSGVRAHTSRIDMVFRFTALIEGCRAPVGPLKVWDSALLTIFDKRFNRLLSLFSPSELRATFHVPDTR